ISADRNWMDYLESRGHIRPGTRVDLLANRLVVIAPAGRAAPLSLQPGALAAALDGGRLAMASVATVPAGKYGKAALEHLGLWEEV
ncbi:substrate-binding domain-containing protein, partial [Escherichia coli]|nr:substrate-binding domain-containing protein [Escherichia coli]